MDWPTAHFRISALAAARFPSRLPCSTHNASQWLKDSAAVTFRRLSVLDAGQMNALGTYDVVYSCGVRHHTGHMQAALENAAQRLAQDGTLMVAIYNRRWSSVPWRFIKRLYNHVPGWAQRLLIWIFIPVIFLAKWPVTFRNPLKMQRGMDFGHNIVDWLDGYPYEYAGIQEMRAMLQNMGFEIVKVFPARVPTGCNEFASRKTS